MKHMTYIYIHTKTHSCQDSPESIKVQTSRNRRIKKQKEKKGVSVCEKKNLHTDTQQHHPNTFFVNLSQETCEDEEKKIIITHVTIPCSSK